MVFTNKHVVSAMLVAPVLAVLAWFGAGEFIGEQPRHAEPGASYPLLEKSNCRYGSGACDLQNEDFKLTLTRSNPDSELLLRSSHPLAGVVLGQGLPEENVAPVAMLANDSQGMLWRLPRPAVPRPQERIRIVAMAGGTAYFGDAATTFLQPVAE